MKRSASLPTYCHHTIGVGAWIYNDETDEVLVIKENPVGPHVEHWKLPGGSSDIGEDIQRTAVREVKEETGIDCEFISLLGFRQLHNFRYGKSDLYFVCRMKPIGNFRQLKMDGNELSACKWMPVDEYIQYHQLHKPNGLNLVIAEKARRHFNQNLQKPTDTPSKPITYGSSMVGEWTINKYNDSFRGNNRIYTFVSDTEN
jgi:ADP-ribose pyrophosphatase YjhB (NUDIX family)